MAEETRAGLTFEQWKARVNRRVIAATGLDCDFLPDVDYWCSWDCGMTSAEMAREVLEESGFPQDDGDN